MAWTKARETGPDQLRIHPPSLFFWGAYSVYPNCLQRPEGSSAPLPLPPPPYQEEDVLKMFLFN